MEVLKQPIQNEAPQAPIPVKIEQTGTSITPDENPLKDASEQPIEKLEVWEGENNKKYINEYFGTHNLSHEFNVKMPTSEINKYILEQIDERGFEKTTTNYKDILAEIEKEIGSEKLTLFSRFQKITGYIRAMRKLYQAKKLKEKYLITHTSD